MEKKRAYIDGQLCTLCEDCPPKGQCPTGSIRQEEEGEPLYVDLTCIGCGRCARLCLKRAIVLL